jgi:hypothetical protein
MLKKNLLGSFGKLEEFDESIQGSAGRTGYVLEHSFFKHLPEVIVENNHSNVKNFDINDPFLIESKVSRKSNLNYSGNKQLSDVNEFGNTEEVLFSGYFGQRNEKDYINGSQHGEDKTNIINPFLKMGVGIGRQNSTQLFDPINRASLKKQRVYKTLTALNNSASSHNRHKNSFSDLIKSVSLNSSAFCKKKSRYF